MRERLKEKILRAPRLMIVAAGAAVVVPGVLLALTATVGGGELVHFCYVPGSGTVYRIQAPGLKEECSSELHTEFTMNVQGVPGEQGPPGEEGPSGVLDIQVVEGMSQIDDDNPSRVAFVSVECPPGYRVVGGGAGQGTAAGNDVWVLTRSSPATAGSGTFENDGWSAFLQTADREVSSGLYIFSATAICVSVDGGSEEG